MVLVYQAEQDDTIDFLEVALTLWRGKWLIAGITLLFAFGALAYDLLAPATYRTEIVLAPNDSDEPSGVAGRLGALGGLASLAGINLGSFSANGTEALAMFRSRAFVEEFIKDKNLLPVLFPDDWDSAKERWIEDDPADQPDIRDGVKLFMDDVRTITEDRTTGLVTLAIEWSDPEVATQWASELVDRINERVRAQDLKSSELRLKYLNDELQKASLVELRQAISQLIQNDIQTITVARAEREYAFKVMDPARVPKEPVSPRRVLVLVFAVLVGGALGAGGVLVRSAVKNRPTRRQQ